MDVDLSRIRRVILNHRMLGNRPNRDDIDIVVDHLPDAKILGFGKYGFLNTWFLLVYSGQFAPLEDGVIYPLNMSTLRSTYPIKAGGNPYFTPPPPKNAS